MVIQRLRRRVYLYHALEDVKPSEGETPDGNVSFVLAGTCNGIVTLPIWWQRSSGKRPPTQFSALSAIVGMSLESDEGISHYAELNATISLVAVCWYVR